MARLYGLTGREAAVAVLLLQGKSPGEVAAILAMTVKTVRTHIRHLFAKMGVDRLSELMRVFLRGPGVGQSMAPQASESNILRYVREASVSRDGGQVGSGGRPA